VTETVLLIVVALLGAYLIALWVDAREAFDDLSFFQVTGLIAITTLAAAAGLRAWIFDFRWGSAVAAGVVLVAWSLVLRGLSRPRRR
jgi:hypothetical protein